MRKVSLLKILYYRIANGKFSVFTMEIEGNGDATQNWTQLGFESRDKMKSNGSFQEALLKNRNRISISKIGAYISIIIVIF